VSYRFIADHAGACPVAWMCSALEVSVAGYYAWAGRSPGPADARRQRLVTAIRATHAEVKGR
jgi:putative transposase